MASARTYFEPYFQTLRRIESIVLVQNFRQPFAVIFCRVHYLIMTTFMLHGSRVRVSGRLWAPRLVLVGGAQTLFCDRS